MTVSSRTRPVEKGAMQNKNDRGFQDQDIVEKKGGLVLFC